MRRGGSTKARSALTLLVCAAACSCAACGGSAAEMKGMHVELNRVQRDHDALARRVGDLEGRDAERTEEAPVAASAPAGAPRVKEKPLAIIKLAPATTGSIVGDPASTTSAAALATTTATIAEDSDEDSEDEGGARARLRIGPGGAIEQTLPDEVYLKKKKLHGAAPHDPQAAHDYDGALALVRAKKYKQGLDALAGFVLRYPDHPYVANAMYWRGDCYFALGEYQSAVAQLEGVIARFPSSAKVPDTLLKLALSQKKLGSPAKARVTFDRLRKDYPLTEAARKIPTEDAP